MGIGALVAKSSFVERVRAPVRSVLGYQSLPYRLAAAAMDFGSVLISEGPATALALRRLRRQKDASAPSVSVKFKRLLHPISLRPGSRDIDTLVSNAVRLEYGQLELSKDAPHFIVDGGAYIGDTSAFFLSRHPNATVVSLEPNPESFEIAACNLAPYGERGILLNKALADKAGELFLSGVETGARLGEAGSIAVECLTVPDLLERSPDGRITVLKLDIEGAEQALFSTGVDAWLDKVDHIIVETHGPECERSVLQALGAAKWSVRRYRNLYYCSAPHLGPA